jgi:hypothetical protein
MTEPTDHRHTIYQLLFEEWLPTMASPCSGHSFPQVDRGAPAEAWRSFPKAVITKLPRMRKPRNVGEPDVVKNFAGAGLLLRRRAFDELRPWLAQTCDLVDIGAEEPLFYVAPARVSGALVHELSNVRYFKNGSVMDIATPVGHAKKLEGVPMWRFEESTRLFVGYQFVDAWNAAGLIGLGFHPCGRIVDADLEIVAQRDRASRTGGTTAPSPDASRPAPVVTETQSSDHAQADDEFIVRKARRTRSTPRIAVRPASGSGLDLIFGGRPRVPEGFVWPEDDGGPLLFLARIDCVAVHRALGAELPHWFPRTGSLAFFFCCDAMCDVDFTDPRVWRVQWFDGTVPSVEMAQPNDDELEQFGFRLEAFVSAPSAEESGYPQHQVLGHPVPVQPYDVEDDLPVGAGSGPDDPANDWQLLLQIDSDQEFDLMWADGGRLYFWVRPSDAQKRDYSGCWLTIQHH